VGIRYNRTVDSLFLAFFLCVLDRKSYFLKYLLYIFRYLYGFWSGGGLICDWSGFHLTSLRPCITVKIHFCEKREVSFKCFGGAMVFDKMAGGIQV
jgi:hypothetical protein